MKAEEEIRTEMVRLRKDLTFVRERIKYFISTNDIDLFTREIISLRARENYILGQLGFATWVINK